MAVITRFAPSPTGYLHLGHAFAARAAWQAARMAGGRFLLRIEDIDRQRCRLAFTESILEDLHWLGLDWDGPVRVQSAHFPEYRATLRGLYRRRLVYPCFCTRADIAREVAAAASAPQGPDGPLYPGLCRDLTTPEVRARFRARLPFALRLNMARATAQAGPLHRHEHGEGSLACDPARFGDVVLARKDTPGSYHLCATQDDATQGVSLVTRGDDLRPAADLHRLLQALLGWPAPEYAHHRLLAGADGRRLAKRDGAPSLRQLRADGAAPADIWALLDQADCISRSGPSV